MRIETIGNATLYLGDCLEVFNSLQAGHIDAAITDPPFAFAGGISNGFASRADSQFFLYWLSDVFKGLHRVCKPESAWFLWSDWKTLSVYNDALSNLSDYYDQRSVSQVLIHDREMIGMGSPFRNQVDYIALVRGKKTKFDEKIPKNQANIFRSYWYYGKHENHPAEKCIEVSKQLCKWIVNNDGKVIDPFMGSGTTGVAALLNGNKFIGIEREPKYFDVACRRIEDATKQQDMFMSGVC